MDSSWQKIAGLLVVVAVAGAFVMWIRSGINEAQNPERSFSDMVEQDKEELLSEPSAKDLRGESVQQPEEPATAGAEEPVEPAGPVTLYFTELDEIDQIAAENLLAVVPTGRSIGRLPMTGYNLMVENCRQIMERWPGSIYDYKARRAMSEIPERYRDMYGITAQELDLTPYLKQRPNTKPYTIREDSQ